MQVDIDTQRAKGIARAIQKRCKTAGATIAYGQALDGLAEGLGYRNWSTLSATLAKQPPAPAAAPETPATQLPMILRFWVEAALKQARPSEIRVQMTGGVSADWNPRPTTDSRFEITGVERTMATRVLEQLPGTTLPAGELANSAEISRPWPDLPIARIHAELTQSFPHPELKIEINYDTSPSAVPAEARIVPGDVHSCDWDREAFFDAAPYFRQLDDQQLRDVFERLERCEYSDDLTVDRLIDWISDQPGQEDVLAALHRGGDRDRYTGDHIGYTATVDARAARAWLQANKPAIFADLLGDDTIDPDDAAEAAKPLGAPVDASDRNTAITYEYRDGANYHTQRTYIVAGGLSAAEIDEISLRLDEGEYFIPGQVGLPDLQDSFVGCASHWDPQLDHPWHLLGEIESTPKPATVALEARELLRRFREVQWDDSYKPPFYDEMRQRYESREAAPEDQSDTTSIVAPSRKDALFEAFGHELTGFGPHAFTAFIQRPGDTLQEVLDMRGYVFRGPAASDTIIGLKVDGWIYFYTRQGGLSVFYLFDGTDWSQAEEKLVVAARQEGIAGA
ncbi:hypothetical protein CKO28_00905 [Rhodovibrio sodomensis]|uniref:Glyoxalase-related protein domain-containing protein n=1 Tax=Rhodovibrio sodomensis TaxID=1088 RepID=A0ABS1D865_9PROT|nr:glyoxalase superfamily protein [Rhodovibrio sodomensis]MBK1666601.1 hypothetical protein [Rhodovibrio sodomensis]